MTLGNLHSLLPPLPPPEPYCKNPDASCSPEVDPVRSVNPDPKKVTPEKNPEPPPEAEPLRSALAIPPDPELSPEPLNSRPPFPSSFSLPVCEVDTSSR